MRKIIVLILALQPWSLFAETVLYVCTFHGHTTLQSMKPTQCDKLTTYHYPTYSKQSDSKEDLNPNASTGLRAEEIRQLEATTSVIPYSTETLVRRYENVDERIGFAYLNNYFDYRQDKCAAYRRQLESALFYIDAKNSMMIEIGPYRSAELAAQINQALPQVNYYCR